MFGFGHKNKKTAVLILPTKQYDETEFHTLEKVFRKHHIKSIRAATSILGPVTGMHQKETLKPEIKLSELQLDQCDALVLIGGLGVREHYNDQNLHRVLQKANQMEKTIAAIDYAPIVLAHAEILNHKCATVIGTEEQKLQAAGAHYTGTAIEVDGNIVTGSSSAHAEEFAETVAQVILGEYVVPVETNA